MPDRRYNDDLSAEELACIIRERKGEAWLAQLHGRITRLRPDEYAKRST